MTDEKRKTPGGVSQKQLQSTAQAVLLSILQTTDHDHRAQRQALVRSVKASDKSMQYFSDRELRICIHELRCQGYRIVSTSDTTGYYLTEDLDDPGLIAFEKEIRSRNKEHCRMLRAMKRGVSYGKPIRAK